LPDPVKSLRKLYNDDRQFHAMAKVGIESNGSDGEAMLANTRWKLATMWHLGYHDEHGYENEINLGKYLGKMQWLYPYVGFDYHYRKVEEVEKNYFGQVSNKNDRKAFVLGVEYTLPMLIVADGRVDTDGKFRFQLGREDIPVTSRLRLNLMANTDKEYAVGLRYVVSKYFSLSTHYDSDMGWGAGFTITY
ncbi:MAG: copper oxidase, partial [Saprospiraceae bacterium]